MPSPDDLVAALSRDHGCHPYSKWRGAHWRLASLAELAPPGHPAALAAAESTLGWLASPRRLRSFPALEGRVRRCASQDGLALYSCCRIGLGGDERLARLAESLVATQWPDGGWNCDRRPEASHSSFHESWAPTMGLAEFARSGADGGAQEAAERGAEFLLRHRVVYSHRSGELHARLTKVRFPPYWHYDVLAGLLTLERSVGVRDARCSDALDLLEAKRGADGRWRAEGRWWKRPGSSGSGVEAVDWGEAADELLTERALGVLRAAGRS